ncbi:MAG: transketolase [Caldilineaceae bacterium]|nr:transketolase [Caldilineaceae bacterium]
MEKGGWMSTADIARLRERARFIRTETVRLITIAKSGHYTSIFSAAEILSVLYYHVMQLRDDPLWADRDRLILSKGHVAVGVYPILADKGFFPTSWLDNYARLGSPLGDHPDMRKVPGVDFSSGSLGHGLSIGVGMALGLNRKRSPGRVFVLLGDGELNEGQNWEAAQAGAHYKLGNLIGIVDRNTMGLDGLTEDTMSIEPLADKWRAFNWDVHEVDGHNLAALVETFDSLPREGERPQMIIAHTIKGKGVKYMEESRLWHLGHLAGADAEATIEEILQNELG